MQILIVRGYGGIQFEDTLGLEFCIEAEPQNDCDCFRNQSARLPVRSAMARSVRGPRGERAC